MHICNILSTYKRNCIMKKTLLLASFLLTSISAFAHYPYVHINNTTSEAISGEVRYAVCKDDYFTISPHTAWTAESRGLCLVKGISAQDIEHPSFKIHGYHSSGTTYSQFAVIKDGDHLAITRVVT